MSRILIVLVEFPSSNFGLFFWFIIPLIFRDALYAIILIVVVSALGSIY